MDRTRQPSRHHLTEVSSLCCPTDRRCVPSIRSNERDGNTNDAKDDEQDQDRAEGPHRALNEFAALLVIGPDRPFSAPGGAEMAGRSRKARLAAAVGFRPGDLTDPARAVRLALRRLARRIQHLDAEISEATAELNQLTRQAAPVLWAGQGVGPDPPPSC
jgi:hypothetical protein